MNATMVATGTKAVPPVVSSIQDIPLAKIRESKTNPRRIFDEAKLAELSENIRQHGVLQPILVRPLPDGEAGTYELVAGARRFRASKIAKRESIPATVRELTDAQALELQVIENVQRVDVHPLDEARGYAALIELQPDTYTVEGIAARVGRSPAYVSGRLRLIQLIPEAKQASYEDKLTVARAFEIARLQPNDQRRALQECFPQYRNAAAALKDKKAEAVTVRELREWIAREIHLDLTNAPFDPQDEKLLPAAGACSRCLKQTGSNPLLFPEIPRRASICTERECHGAKVEALVQIQVKPLEEKGEKPLRVSLAPAWQANGHAKDVLFEGQYRKAKAKGECPNTKAAVLIDGKNAGSIFYLCQAEKCDVHNRVARYQPTPQELAQRKKEALAERVEKLSRVRVLEAIRKKLPDALSRPDLEMVALDYFRRLGHDNQRRLSKLYAWEEKKSKTVWGAETVDYEKIAAVAVQAMKPADLNRFLVVCALVSDLYCPGYNPRQPLGKNSNLAQTAERHKVNSAKIATGTRAELSKPKDKLDCRVTTRNKQTASTIQRPSARKTK
jgi:ParB family transcriptional regulator, chromosome partitioning protein